MCDTIPAERGRVYAQICLPYNSAASTFYNLRHCYHPDYRSLKHHNPPAKRFSTFTYDLRALALWPMKRLRKTSYLLCKLYIANSVPTLKPAIFKLLLIMIKNECSKRYTHDKVNIMIFRHLSPPFSVYIYFYNVFEHFDICIFVLYNSIYRFCNHLVIDFTRK